MLSMKNKYLLVVCISLGIVIGLGSFKSEAPPAIVEDVLAETNRFRNSNGLADLKMVEALNDIAQKHSENMASGKVAFGHAGFDKRNAQASRQISSLSSFAENVAYGAPNAKEVVTMWKNSSGHRRNMLGKYIFIGIGVAKNKKGELFYTQVFGG